MVLHFIEVVEVLIINYLHFVLANILKSLKLGLGALWYWLYRLDELIEVSLKSLKSILNRLSPVCSPGLTAFPPRFSVVF